MIAQAYQEIANETKYLIFCSFDNSFSIANDFGTLEDNITFDEAKKAQKNCVGCPDIQHIDTFENFLLFQREYKMYYQFKYYNGDKNGKKFLIYIAENYPQILKACKYFVENQY